MGRSNRRKHVVASVVTALTLGGLFQAAPTVASADALDGASIRIFPTKSAATSAAIMNVTQPQLTYHGGRHNIGVTISAPRVYLVFWGSQWGAESPPGSLSFANDWAGMAPRVRALFQGIGTDNEQWSGVMTQYCEGVPGGATSCPASARHVPYPTGGTLAGTWVDTALAAPGTSTPRQIASEALRAAVHFGNTTSAANRNAQYMIVSAASTHPNGFPNGGWCAWHDWSGDYANLATYGDIAFTNLPYIPTAGTNCGANFVNADSSGDLDGVTIVAGHEYAETITDQNPSGGWLDSSGWENADKCAWRPLGTVGGADNVAFSTGNFAMQGTWSNDTKRCALTHPTITGADADFSMSATPTTASVAPGGTVIGSVGTATTLGVAQTLLLSSAFLPGGMTSTFAPDTITSGGASTFAVTVSTATPPGTYPLLLVGSGQHVHAVLLTITVTGTALPALANGVAVNGLSAPAGSSHVWRFDVPAGQSQLQFTTGGGSGNVDVYAKLGAVPTTADFTCRSVNATNTDTCTIANPAAGTYFVVLQGTSAYSGTNLEGLYTSALDQPLTRAVSVSQIAGGAGSQQFWTLSVPSGVAKLTFSTTGSLGDVDLYIRRGSHPTTATYKCRSFTPGDVESCSVATPGSGTWFVMLRGYGDYAGVTLTGTY
ncbi:MAG TPA: PPC domain-containing protein [Acidimicrobiia bacterium]|nr:PPC domain-containing protein [Acidimicrobiia bacterium]